MINKDAIQYLQETVIKPEERIVYENERIFAIDSYGNAVELLDPHERIIEVYGRLFEVDIKGNLTELPYCEQRIANLPLNLNTLSGMVDYIKAKFDRAEEQLFILINNEQEVTLSGALNIDGNREKLAVAKAIIPKFIFDHFYDSEEMNITLQSKFVQIKDRDILLQVLGNAVEENVKDVGDDGVSQSIAIRQGIASKAEVKVPNPVILAPYRTFVEVEQPESKFIFRMKEGPRAAIFEADGGAWRNEAIANIKAFLTEHLSREIENGKITILA